MKRQRGNSSHRKIDKKINGIKSTIKAKNGKSKEKEQMETMVGAKQQISRKVQCQTSSNRFNKTRSEIFQLENIRLFWKVPVKM